MCFGFLCLRSGARLRSVVQSINDLEGVEVQFSSVAIPADGGVLIGTSDQVRVAVPQGGIVLVIKGGVSCADRADCLQFGNILGPAERRSSNCLQMIQ